MLMLMSTITSPRRIATSSCIKQVARSVDTLLIRSVEMNRLCLVLVLGITLGIASAAVEQLNAKSGAAFLRSGSGFLLFTAPDCDTCHKLVEAMENPRMEKYLADVRVGHIDMKQYKKFASKFGVRVAGETFITRDGQFRKYDGLPSPKAIGEFFQKFHGVSVKTISDKASKVSVFDTEEHNPRVVGYFADANGEDARSFAKVAELLHHPTAFFIVTDAKIAKSLKLKSEGDVAYVAPYGKPTRFNGDFSSTSELSSFLSQQREAIPQYRAETAGLHSTNGGIDVYLVITANDKNAAALIKQMKKVSKKFKSSDSHHFYYSVASNAKDMLEQYSLTVSDLPTVVAYDHDRRKYFSYSSLSSKWTDSNIVDFVKDFSDGKLRRSQNRIPESDQGIVRHITANSFDEEVLNSGKHSIVEFYAPWCGHCKKLAPEFKKAAEHFKENGEDDVQLVMFDATLNDAPEEYGVKGFPTIIYVPPQNAEKPAKKPFEKYTGNRDFDGLVQFVADKKEGRKRSEPVPETQDGPVHVLVANNFDEEVLQKERAAFVEFYAPWCGHCKALAPKFDELGEQMADSNVLIGKIDATANEIDESYGVKGYPTLLYFPAGLNDKSNFEKYKGARDVNGMAKFLKEKLQEEGGAKEEL